MESEWMNSLVRQPENNQDVLVILRAKSKYPEDRRLAVARYNDGVFNAVTSTGYKQVEHPVIWMPSPQLPYVGKHGKK